MYNDESSTTPPAINSVFQNSEFSFFDIGDDIDTAGETSDIASNPETPDDSDRGEIQAKLRVDSIASSKSGPDTDQLDTYCPSDTTSPGKPSKKRQICPPPRHEFIEGNDSGRREGIDNGRNGRDDATLLNEKISKEDSVWDQEQAAENHAWASDNVEAKRLCEIIGLWRLHPVCCLGPGHMDGTIMFQQNCDTYVFNRPRCRDEDKAFCCHLLDKYYKFRWGYLGRDCVAMFPRKWTLAVYAIEFVLPR